MCVHVCSLVVGAEGQRNSLRAEEEGRQTILSRGNSMNKMHSKINSYLINNKVELGQ